MKNFYLQISVKILLLFLYLINTSNVFATTYYVSSTGGDDSRSGSQAQSIMMPWRSLARVSAESGSFQAGDQILFKRGEVFKGTLTVSASGTAGSPVVFGAYGEGALPELTGFVTLTDWQQKGGNVWEAVVPGGLSYLNTVTVNGVAKAVGRYPNATAANGGYLTY